MYAADPTGGVQGAEEGQQGHKHISQKIFHGSKNIQMAAMERHVSIISCCVFLCCENGTKLKKHINDKIGTHSSLKTLFHQFLNDTNDLHGEGKKRNSLVSKSWHKMTIKQLVSLDLKVER